MEGKRNRCLDHLIYVLIEKAIPYFRARHHRQHLGFEGPDLEIQRRIEIAERAKTIQKSDISLTEDPSTFRVKSQSIQNFSYDVDLVSHHCNCLSFLLVNFCKHISAVQLHHVNEDGDEEIIRDKHSKNDNNSDEIVQIASKLQELTNQLLFDPPGEITNELRDLGEHLNTVNDSLGPSKPLLQQKKRVAPNQHSWTETASIMGAKVKGKRARTHTDPYAGGERSGKKARPDTRQPLIDIGCIAVHAADIHISNILQSTSTYRHRRSSFWQGLRSADSCGSSNNALVQPCRHQSTQYCSPTAPQVPGIE